MLIEFITHGPIFSFGYVRLHIRVRTDERREVLDDGGWESESELSLSFCVLNGANSPERVFLFGGGLFLSS
jgi:hypothetical protein